LKKPSAGTTFFPWDLPMRLSCAHKFFKYLLPVLQL
jgi:hypothetical protein